VEVELTFTLDESVQLWSAENPALYSVVVELTAPNGQTHVEVGSLAPPLSCGCY
jgi:beta-galactosidase/beta-glucuronidase